MNIRVLLLAEHPIARAGLRALLKTEVDIEVVGEADGGISGINLARQLRPDVVVTELLLPDLDGIAVTQRIRAELPATQVVLLTRVSEVDASIVGAVRAGAIGYVFKNADVEALIQTIRSAARGDMDPSPQTAARQMHEVRSPRIHVRLTAREREVLYEITIGRSNKQIARSLRIAENTVKWHVRAIFDKLGVESRTQAALQTLRY